MITTETKMPQLFAPSPLTAAADPTAALVHLQNLAPNRRGLLLAPLFAALPAGLLASSANALESDGMPKQRMRGAVLARGFFANPLPGGFGSPIDGTKTGPHGACLTAACFFFWVGETGETPVSAAAGNPVL
jgi:hypothetical protein